MTLHKKLLLYLLLSVLAVSVWFTFTTTSAFAVVSSSCLIMAIFLGYMIEIEDAVEDFKDGYDLMNVLSASINHCNSRYTFKMVITGCDADFVEYCKVLANEKVFYNLQYAKSRKELAFWFGMEVYKLMHTIVLWRQRRFISRIFKTSRHLDHAIMAPEVEFYLFKKHNPEHFIHKA